MLKSIETTNDDGTLKVFHHYGDALELMESPWVNSAGQRDFDKFVTEMKERNEVDQNRWWGLPSLEALKGAFKFGWPEGTKKMREAISDIEVPALPSLRRKKKWRDTGDSLDIHRVNMGRIDTAWQRAERVPMISRGKSHVTVVADLCVSGGTDADDVMWRGAAATAVIEAALASGRSVRALLVIGDRGPFKNVERVDIAVEIKQYHESVTTDVLMTYLSLPGFFRYYGIKAIMNLEGGKSPNFGFGSVDDFQRNLLDDGSQMIWIGKDVLSKKEANSAAKSAIKAMVRRQDSAEAYFK